MSSPVLRRVVRRETHSPRTAAMVVVVVLVILALLYAGVELVLSMAGRPPLLVAPADAFDRLIGLPTAAPAGALIAGGVLVGVVGVVLIVLAVSPGRLSKHQLVVGDSAVVADNGVIASAIAQRVSDDSGLPREQVRVGVGHRAVDVTLTPDVGVPVDEQSVRAAVDAEVQSYHLATRLRTSLRVDRPRRTEEDA